MMKIVPGVIAAALMWPTPQVSPVVAAEHAERTQVTAAPRAAATCSESLRGAGVAAAGVADAPPSDLRVQVGELNAEGVGAFGSASGVAITADGATAVVGAAGAAYVFTTGPSGWGDAIQVARLGASDGVAAYFGHSVAISDDGATVAVAAMMTQIGANASAGAVYVFTRPAAGWSDGVEPARLTASDDGAGDQLGYSLALSADGTTIAAGAQLWNLGPSGTVVTAGKAYVFTRPATGWASRTETAQLTASNRAAGDCFGSGVAVDRDATTIVVGARLKTILGVECEGAAFVFVRTSPTLQSWSEAATLTLPLPSDIRYADQLGDSVAVSRDGSTVVAGAIARGSIRGAACVYVRPASGWASTSAATADLTASDGSVSDWLGSSVAMSADGSLIVAGAPGKQIGIGSGEGQAYTFVRPAAGWASATESSRFLGPSGESFGLGAACAVTGDGSVVVVGRGRGPAGVFQRGDATVWVPVASHIDGANGSRWRSALSVFNPGATTAHVEVRLHTPGGVLSGESVVPGGRQAVLDDVVGQLGFAGSAALEVISDQRVVVTSRTYTPSANGTVGQSYASYRTGEGLASGYLGPVWLPLLAENAAYRTNISLTNTSAAPASADVTLHDGTGTVLAQYLVNLAPGEWKQENRPFFTRAGQTAMDEGFAEVSVRTGYGIIATASVADNVTNDPATVEPAFGVSGSGSEWLPVTSHSTGANGSEWRTDVAVLNTGPYDRELPIVLHTENGDVESWVAVPANGQTVLSDVVGQFGSIGSAPLEVQYSLGVTSRSYTRCGPGTVGQSYRAYSWSQGLAANQFAWLPQLAENAAYRTNILLTNIDVDPASARVDLYDGAGGLLGTYVVDLAPGEWKQENRPFFTKAGQTAMDQGYAKVTVTSGYAVVATASVVDNGTNDPTTVPMVR